MIHLAGATRITVMRVFCRFLCILAEMGIHHGRIFPGCEGIASTIKLRNLPHSL